MDSKSGGHDAGIRGRGGHSKAFDASCLNLSSDEIFCQNSVGAAVCSKDGGRSRAEEEKVSTKNRLEKVKLYEISLKTTSNGGCGEDTSLLKALQVKRLAEKLAENSNHPEQSDQISRSAVNSISGAHRSKLQTSNGSICKKTAMEKDRSGKSL